MKIKDLPPAQRIVLQRIDPVTKLTHATTGHEKTYHKAVELGLLERVHGIMYKATDLGMALRKKM